MFIYLKMLVLAMQFSRDDMTMPRSRERGSASEAIRTDCALKAEETNTDHHAPEKLREDDGRVTSA
jgi:hypothetical protein